MQIGTVGQRAVAAARGGEGGSRRRPRRAATGASGALAPRTTGRRRTSSRTTRQSVGRRTVEVRAVGRRRRPRLFHVACGYMRAEGLRLSRQASPRGLEILGRLLIIVDHWFRAVRCCYTRLACTVGSDPAERSALSAVLGANMRGAIRCREQYHDVGEERTPTSGVKPS